jgi:hypothetical protein
MDQRSLLKNVQANQVLTVDIKMHIPMKPEPQPAFAYGNYRFPAN